VGNSTINPAISNIIPVMIAIVPFNLGPPGALIHFDILGLINAKKPIDRDKSAQRMKI